MQVKSKEELQKLGGAEGLARKLNVSLHKGFCPGKDNYLVERRRQVFGENRFRVPSTKSFWSLVIENLQDPTLILLMAAALVRLETINSTCAKSTILRMSVQVSTVIGAAVEEEREQNAWTEGIAIWVAVTVVSLVGAHIYAIIKAFPKSWLSKSRRIVIVHEDLSWEAEAKPRLFQEL